MTISKSLACRAALAAAIASAACTGIAVAKPQGVTYSVHVASSFGTHFRDCFSFDTADNMTVGGYGTLIYTPGGRGSAASKFQSVSPAAVATNVGFALEFTGIALGDGTSGAIKGSGSNEAGDAFSFHGFPDAGCSAASQAASPYHRP